MKEIITKIVALFTIFSVISCAEDLLNNNVYKKGYDLRLLGKWGKDYYLCTFYTKNNEIIGYKIDEVGLSYYESDVYKYKIDKDTLYLKLIREMSRKVDNEWVKYVKSK